MEEREHTGVISLVRMIFGVEDAVLKLRRHLAEIDDDRRRARFWSGLRTRSSADVATADGLRPMVPVERRPADLDVLRADGPD
ncbi:hypothetical protein [Lentzea sp. NEAU-D7]|uniref:hypothetical protein n=1 Tax=Lentzea sp. NEAU-D7 TaxID=2994667 RepID=UPI00224B6B9F|nr:hypothetical protein [Lentzea sp. NEAU-D7]MCX2954546.1 hypothetical protein [Lentzea sp. NEAU-D7]